MKRIQRSLALVLALVLILVASTSAQNSSVQLAFLVDGSSSISYNDFQVMLDGIAAAIEDSACVPHDGSLELTVIQFSTTVRTEVGPVVITSANAGAVASQIRSMTKMHNMTNYADAVDLAVAEMQASPNWSSSRQVINITTDGYPNTPDETAHRAAVQRAINAGIDEIDAEGISVTTSTASATDVAAVDPITVLRDEVVYPQPGTLHPPAPWPPTASGWVRLVDNAQEFADTVCEKFGVIIEPPWIPEPATLLLLGSGLAGLAGYVRLRGRKRRQ